MPHEQKHHNEKRPDTLDLLFRYYQTLKQDLLLQTGGFKNHVRNSQIAVTAVLTLLGFMATSTSFSISDQSKWGWVGVGFAVTTIIYYLIYDVLEAVFAIRALEECLSFLEIRMNRFLGANRLIWQSAVAENLWPSTTKKLGFLPPIRCLEFYEMLLVSGATLLLPGYIYYQVWLLSADNCSLRFILFGLALYSAASAGWTVYMSHIVNEKVRSRVHLMLTERWNEIAI